MAPILSLPLESLYRIREDVALSVVSVWEMNDSGSKVSLRSGFVFDYDDDDDICIVLTVSEDLDRRRKIFVQFENGECFEGLIAFGDNKSKLAAVLVTGFGFEPKKVLFSEHNAHQCEEVVHMGMFDEENPRLNFSSGSAGLVGHRAFVRKEDEGFTCFVHCCSQRLHLLGGPVFNLHSEIVGANYAQKKDKNLFFALDIDQLKIELERLFGEQMEHVAGLKKEVGSLRAKRKKEKEVAMASPASST